MNRLYAIRLKALELLRALKASTRRVLSIMVSLRGLALPLFGLAWSLLGLAWGIKMLSQPGPFYGVPGSANLAQWASPRLLGAGVVLIHLNLARIALFETIHRHSSSRVWRL